MEYSNRAKQIRIYFGKRKREFFNRKVFFKSAIPALIIIILLSLVCNSDFLLPGNEAATKRDAFLVLCACIWNGLFNSIQTICKEREIIKHEHRAGMYLSSYILGYAGFDFFICLLNSFITWLVVVIKFFPNISESGAVFPRALGYLITFIIVTYAADALGILVSSIVKTPDMAMKVMPFILIIELAFSNVLLTLPKCLDKVSWLTFGKWGTQAFLDIAYYFGKGGISLNFSVREHMFASEVEYAGFILSWGAMLVFIVVSLLLAMVFLRSVDKDQR